MKIQNHSGCKQRLSIVNWYLLSEHVTMILRSVKNLNTRNTKALLLPE